MKRPWYIRNADLHRDLGIDPVKTENHSNGEVSNLLVPEGIRRLRRVRPLDLAQ